MQIISKLLKAVMVTTLLGMIPGCHQGEKVYMKLEKKPFGKTTDGQEVFVYTLANKKGMEVKIMNYGGIVLGLRVPDRIGKFDDVVLGYNDLESYIKNNPYFGALIGRYGNRIARGRFMLNNVSYQLATNNGENHLHGGIRGYDKVFWDADEMESDTTIGLRLKYFSPDGEEGYPGNLDITVIYTVTNQNELQIVYQATTDKQTIVNLTHHSYFNLAGAGARDILAQELWIDADRFTPVDKGLIPTGVMKDVAGTPMDFRIPTAIGTRISADDEQLRYAGGYDHNWVLNKTDKSLTRIADVHDPETGRVMEVYTTEPGLQFYSGNFLDGTITGKAGKVYQHRFGYCLEPQHFPDSPNQSGFPPTDLKPGEKYYQKTIYKFLTR